MVGLGSCQGQVRVSDVEERSLVVVWRLHGDSWRLQDPVVVILGEAGRPSSHAGTHSLSGQAFIEHL